MSKHWRLLALGQTAMACMAIGSLAHAQQPPADPPQEAASEAAQQAAPADADRQASAEWTGLPFTSLADYERLIPIGMTLRDLVGALGRPSAITPGMGADQAHHYEYVSGEGTQFHAVIIVRDGAVFIRRLYISSPSGATARAN